MQATKGQAPPPGMGQGMSLRVAISSPNQIAEPYRSVNQSDPCKVAKGCAASFPGIETHQRGCIRSMAFAPITTVVGRRRVIQVIRTVSNALCSGTPAKLPFVTSWFTPTGWRERWDRFMASAKSMYTIRA